MVVKDGPDGLKTLTMDADALKKAMSGALGEAKGMKKSLIDLGAVSFGLDAISGALSSLQGMMKGLTDAYDVQVEAETKLETVMRQRMSATEAEIQSIKDLCSAQQQLGVIGDEVQLAGAQQVSTFLQTREALETLIPAMNNLVAQQKGLNATSGDAVNIGNLLGKAMQGQTAALRRVGITFTEAEERAVKYGTEQERAAALAKIITNNVGEMNAALARTDAGQMKQIDNAVGDIKEKIGGLVKGIQPYVTTANQCVIAGNNIIKLSQGFLPLIQRTISWMKAINGTTLAAKALQIAIRGIVVGAAIGAVWALIQGVRTLAGQTGKLAEQRKMLNGITSEATQKMGEQKTQVDLLVKAARNENLALEDRHSAIKKLNDIIPGYNGQLDETTGKYKENKQALDDYLKSLVKQYEIEGAREKLQELGRKKADAMLRRQEAIREYNDVKKQQKTSAQHAPGIALAAANLNQGEVGNATFDRSRENAAYKKIVSATREVNDATADENAILGAYGNELMKTAATGSKAADEIAKAAEDADKKKNKPGKSTKPPKEEVLPKGSIAAYEKEIADLNKKISLEVDPQKIAAMNKQIAEIKAKIEDMKIRAKIILDKDEFDKFVQQLKIERKPTRIKIKAEVDPGIMKLKDLDLGASGWYRDFQRSQEAAQKLQTKLNGVAETGRAASSAFSSMGDAMESPVLNVAAIIAGAIANIMAGYAAAAGKAGGQSSSPWEWIAFAVSGLATAVAAVASIKQATAFANGGIVSGPTMALVGEYAGASNNPEVIAPLNKLRELLPDEGSRVQRVVVTGRIKGSDIELSQRNRQRIHRK